MFAIMSFQRVRRLKFLWLEDSWIQRKVPPFALLCTKANNVKKPVRYTSIKKAKPKTIIDIARLLQQKTKETKERKQSVIPAAALKAATSTTTPASPNQLNDHSDAIVPNAKVQTSTSTLQAIVSVDTKAVQYRDVEAVTGSSLNVASKLPLTVSRTSCETIPDSVLIDPAVDFAYSKCADQMAIEGLHSKTYTEISIDAAPKAVDSGVESPASNAPQEDVTTNISRVSELSANTKEVFPSSEDVAYASKKLTPDVEEIVDMHEVTVTSKLMATTEVSPAHEDGHLEESFSDPEVVTPTNASTFVNIAQAQYTSQPQSQDFIAPSWSSNANADKTPSSQEIINQAVGAAESIMDIFRAEAVAVACGEIPTLREVCLEEAIPVSDPIPEVSLFKSTEDLQVVETISASPSKAVKVDGMREMSDDAQSSVNLKDTVLTQTDVLEEEVQKEFEELPEAQLDPIQRLFLDKIREYSTKSQASGGLVDAGPEYEKAFNEELTKLQRLYGGGDLSKFPEFKFSEPVLDESSSK